MQGLNEAQKDAVLRVKGPVLILAGAGSGKTRVITHRVAHLVREEKVHPLQICALTFTNKAAAEMRDRLQGLLGSDANMVMMKTFHSLCLYILRVEAEHTDRKSGFTVYDTALQESLLKECMKELGADLKDMKPSFVANRINSAKDDFLSPEQFFHAHRYEPRRELLFDIYELYEAKKKERNAVDFGDLIYKTVHLFLDKPEVLQKYNHRWKYLMVDEYQDTNKIQYELTKLLSGEDKNLCVVGDDDQSIYSWRGADIRNILNFEKDFPDTYVVKLEENYRSTRNIITAAASVIANNSNRKDKTLYTKKEEGERISLKQYLNEAEEAFAHVKEIKKLYAKTGKYSGMAIFYRTNAQSRYFEEEIRKASIPYKIFGGFRFYDRAEIKDLVAYLSVLVNPLDSTSLLRVINTPPRGIGQKSIDSMIEISIHEGVSLFETLNSDKLELRKNTLTKVKELYQKLLSLMELLESPDVRPSEVVENTITVLGIEEFYKQEGSDESISRLENIQEFLNAIEEYEENTESPSLSEYLEDISLLTSEQEKPELNDYLTLMTVHNSKGLEFDYVFLSGMEEGTFPHQMSIEEGNIEEERRLCYVAITRARQKLYISYCETSRKYGMVDYRDPSRFLAEIPEEYLDRSFASKSGSRVAIRKPEFVPRARDSFSSKPFPTNNKANTNVSNSGGIQKGSKVRHKIYGEGVVLEVSGSGDNRKVKVAFGHAQKNFLLQYTPLELI